MRIPIALLIGTYVALTVVVQAAADSEWQDLSNSRLGCSSVEVRIDAQLLAASGKTAAADKLLTDKLRSGECRMLPAGKVHIERTSPRDQVPLQSCVRPDGFSACWWVPEEYLK